MARQDAVHLFLTMFSKSLKFEYMLFHDKIMAIVNKINYETHCP